jgi:probable F420-dependent oxidoreductase
VQFSVTVPGLTLYGGAQESWQAQLAGAEILGLARRTDELGYDQLRVSEHIVMHRDRVPAMGARWSHSLATMGMLVGATSQIRICGLIVVPYHEPVALAKALASLDFLSGGRVILLAGVGYMPWEFDIVGADYQQRGAMMDEYLDALVELWTSETPTFDGRFTRFSEIAFEPKPVQTPHLPIWIAGYKNVALRRLARIGDGWITYNTTRAELPGKLDYIRSQPAFQTRPRPLEIGMPLFESRHDPNTHAVLQPPRIVLEAGAILEQIDALHQLGVTVTRVDTALGTALGSGLAAPRSKTEYLERLQWFAEEIFPAVPSDRSSYVD